MKKASRSAAQWAEIVREYRESEETEVAFCERKDVTVSSLRKWRYTLAGRSREKVDTAGSGFVRVSASVPAGSGDSVVIDMGEGIRIECPSTLSPSTIAALVRELRHGR